MERIEEFSTGNAIDIGFVSSQSVELTVLPSKIDPSERASRIAKGMHACVRTLIAACVILFETLQLLASDAAGRAEFITALARENVIPRRSARLGDFKKSKVAMLCKIGQYANLLLETRILEYLGPDYSVLYHVVRLYEELAGTHQDRVAWLAQLFENQGNLTREFLIAQLKLIELSRKPKSAMPVLNPLDSTEQLFDLLIAPVIDRDHVSRLSEVRPDHLPSCLRIRQRISDNAVAVIFTRIADLPIVVSKLLDCWGFDRLSQVLLIRNPANSDVTDAVVAVIAHRAEQSRVELDWLPFQAVLDPVSLAMRVAPDAENRLHLFAAVEHEDFVSVIGEANWSTAQ